MKLKERPKRGKESKPKNLKISALKKGHRMSRNPYLFDHRNLSRSLIIENLGKIDIIKKNKILKRFNTQSKRNS